MVKRVGKGVCRWVAAHELWLVVAAAPFLLFPRPGLASALALLALLVPWPCRWLARGKFTRRTSMDGPILGLLLVLPVGLWASSDLESSLRKFVGVILGVALFYALVNEADRTGRLDGIAGGVILSGVAVAVLGLVGTDWAAYKLPLASGILDRLPRLIHNVPGSLGGGFSPNEVGGTLDLYIPLVVAVWVAAWSQRPAGEERYHPFGLRSRTPGLVLLGLGLLVMVITTLLTMSRSALIGLAVGLLALGCLRNRWFLLTALGAGVGVAVLIQRVGVKPVAGFVLGMREFNGLSYWGRLEIWQRALYIISNAPLTGSGLNTFTIVSHGRFPYFRLPPDFPVTHAHNTFLQVAVDLGLPGLAAYVWLLGACGWAVWRVHRRAADPWLRALAEGAGCGLLAHQVFGLVDAVTLGARAGIVLWGILGLVAAVEGLVGTAIDH